MSTAPQTFHMHEIVVYSKYARKYKYQTIFLCTEMDGAWKHKSLKYVVHNVMINLMEIIQSWKQH